MAAVRIQPYVPPAKPQIALVGDCPSKGDLDWSRPFRCYKGTELGEMMIEAGLEMGNCYQTTVIKERPPFGDPIKSLCFKKRDVTDLAKQLGWKDYPFPPIQAGKYLHPLWALELLRLRDELQSQNVNLVITLGAFATWALTGIGAITKCRGTVVESTLLPGQKVLPTFHPGGIVADWSKRVVAVQDFIKASHEADFPEIRRVKRAFHIAEHPREIYEFYQRWLRGKTIAADIETNNNQFISCISFSADPQRALCVPFISYNGRSHTHYWRTSVEEIEAWEGVAAILEGPEPLLWQNGLYDLQYLLKCGIHPRNNKHDTMLSHHARWPELPKSLGFMGSIFCNEAAWKEMRPRGKEKTGKRDE